MPLIHKSSSSLHLLILPSKLQQIHSTTHKRNASATQSRASLPAVQLYRWHRRPPRRDLQCHYASDSFDTHLIPAQSSATRVAGVSPSANAGKHEKRRARHERQPGKLIPFSLGGRRARPDPPAHIMIRIKAARGIRQVARGGGEVGRIRRDRAAWH